MAIQFRRGLKAALDKTKILAGEPAYTTDTKEAFLGDGAGDARQFMFLDQLQPNQQMDIIDGNFQVSSIGAPYNVAKSYANGVGYPIWDTWKLYTADTKCGIARKNGPFDYAAWVWNVAMNTTPSSYQLHTYIEKGVSLLCDKPALTISFMAAPDAVGRKIGVLS